MTGWPHALRVLDRAGRSSTQARSLTGVDMRTAPSVIVLRRVRNRHMSGRLLGRVVGGQRQALGGVSAGELIVCDRALGQGKRESVPTSLDFSNRPGGVVPSAVHRGSLGHESNRPDTAGGVIASDGTGSCWQWGRQCRAASKAMTR